MKVRARTDRPSNIKAKRATSGKRRSSPSFVGLKPASPASSVSKRANRSKGTKHELLLARELRRLGLRFKRNVKTLPGKPDIVFPEERVVVFCDGDFWHGKNWPVLRCKLARGNNPEYWIEKIEDNIRRDQKNSRRLRFMGYNVLRIWESETNANQKTIARRIKDRLTIKLSE